MEAFRPVNSPAEASCVCVSRNDSSSKTSTRRLKTRSRPGWRSAIDCGALELLRRRERIARAASTFGILDHDAVFDQVEDVAVRGVLRALSERRVF